MSLSTREGQCPYCETAQEIIVTIQGQDDLCTVCGNSVPAADE